MKSTKIYRPVIAFFLVVLSLILAGLGESSNLARASSASRSLSAMNNPDGSIYFTGNQSERPIRYAHQGQTGKGSWYVYGGRAGERVRLTIGDDGALREVLMLDQGGRVSISYAAGQRIEYRFYSDQGKFILGSVLYREHDKWFQGLSFQEQSGPLGELVAVTNVNARIEQGLRRLASAPGASLSFFDWSLFPSAHAQEIDLSKRAFVDVFVDQFKIAARVALTVVPSIATATLGPATTAGMLRTAGGALIEVGSVVVAALGAPTIAAVATGVVAGLVADEFFATVQAARNNALAVETVPRTAARLAQFEEAIQPARSVARAAPAAPDRSAPAAPDKSAMPAQPRPAVASVTPREGVAGQALNLVVKGQQLGGFNGLTVRVDDCQPIVRGGTDTAKTYTCTFATAGKKSGSIRSQADDELLFSFEIVVAGDTKPAPATAGPGGWPAPCAPANRRDDQYSYQLSCQSTLNGAQITYQESYRLNNNKLMERSYADANNSGKSQVMEAFWDDQEVPNVVIAEVERTNGKPSGIVRKYFPSNYKGLPEGVGKLSEEHLYEDKGERQGELIHTKVYCQYLGNIPKNNRGKLHYIRSKNTQTGKDDIKYLIPNNCF